MPKSVLRFRGELRQGNRRIRGRPHVPQPTELPKKSEPTMTLVHTDSRGRVSLGKILQPERDYQVTVGPHGVVVMEPVTTITDYERSLLSNETLVAALERGREQAANGQGAVFTGRSRRRS